MPTASARLRQVPRPVLVGALVVLAGLIAAALVVALTSNSDTKQTSRPPKSPAIATTTEAPTTSTQPATTTAPPTTAPATTLPPGEDRLSSASLLGFAGLGPIKLGMAFDDAVAAAHVTVQPDPTCDTLLYGEPGSGVTSISVWGRPTIDTITVSQPGIRTISGIQVGDTRDDVLRTYPAAADGPSIVLTGPDGHIIVFGFTGDDTVESMTLSTSQQTLDLHAKC